MNLFVVGMVADPARAEALERSILEAHRRTTPFAALDHHQKVWRHGHVVAASFSIHAEHVAIGSYVRATETTFDTFAGLPRLAGLASTEPWADALGAARDADRFDPATLGGVWTLVRAHGEEIDLRTSSTGSVPTVLARRPGLVVLSNRVSLARLAAWPEFPIAYDTDALSTLCSRGWLAHDRVPFSGVELLSPGVHVQVRPDAVTVDRSSRLGTDVAPPAEDADIGDVYDAMADELVEAAREVGRLGPRPRLELTGDVNTRLSAAVYAAADVDVLAVTPHPDDHPHSRVAAEVARAAGFDHVCEPVELSPAGILRQTDLQVCQGEGLSNVFDPCPPVRLEPTVEVVRHAFGTLLGGYDNLDSGPRPPVEDVEHARSFLDDLALHNHMLLLREEARTVQQQVNRRTAEELLAEVGAWSFYELAYLRLREGRGTGANRQAAGYGALQPAPMLDDRVLCHIPSIPHAHKRSQRSVFELVRRLAPDLAGVRFAGSRWRFEHDGPDESLDPAGWEDRAPLPLDAPTSDWRVTADGRLWPALVARLEEPDPLLDEIVDRSLLRAALRRDEPFASRDVRTLLGALTARQLVSGAWLDR